MARAMEFPLVLMIRDELDTNISKRGYPAWDVGDSLSLDKRS